MEKKLGKSLQKIAVVGPESTGKSYMAKHLAREFDCFYVPEYSRYYCQGLERNYTMTDEVNIFHGQVAMEDGFLDVVRQSLLMCDTTILTVKIWSDHLFGYTPGNVLDEIRRRNYDFYLLMDIDLPWEDDPLRDFPNKRAHFKEIWRTELRSLNADFQIIRGLGEERLQNGIRAVNEFLHTVDS
ncbi:ATP-binding protein [Membranicola marinus]|uniref:ATP-binding protein n=1 Tax=Membranihabitans marinus TaxID=1227546 RepID=A0A953HMM9_9BACT|nr:ATP-binding protein [Membranihabitans marinus]MBY5957323.1 ATP-binding protein [Membranihabitans marinus]